MCKDTLNERRRSEDKASFPADSRGFFSLFHCSFCFSTPHAPPLVYYLPSCLFPQSSQRVINLRVLLNPSNHGCFCSPPPSQSLSLSLLHQHFDPSLYVPLPPSPSSSVSLCPLDLFLFLLLCATAHFKFVTPRLYRFPPSWPSITVSNSISTSSTKNH